MIFMSAIEFATSVQADLEYLLESNDGQRTAALFLLKLKEERRLTQVAIDDITGINKVFLTLAELFFSVCLGPQLEYFVSPWAYYNGSCTGYSVVVIYSAYRICFDGLSRMFWSTRSS